jgi:hypothetical protein
MATELEELIGFLSSPSPQVLSLSLSLFLSSTPHQLQDFSH